MFEHNADLRMIKARINLLLQTPFFGHLALHLSLIPSTAAEGVDTACTNGEVIKFNRDYIETLTDKQLLGLLAHEILHVALLHPYRMGDRHSARWNVACDYACNAILKQAGFELKDGLFSAEFSKHTAEYIYEHISVTELPANISGLVFNNLDTDGAKDWEIRVQHAAQLDKRTVGNIPALLNLIAVEKTPIVNWKQQLQQYFYVQNDYAWYPPHQIYLQQKLHVPTLVATGLQTVVIAVDTSGSIDKDLLGQFKAELVSITSLVDIQRFVIINCDCSINSVEEVRYIDDANFKFTGGGGTCFKPVFEYIDTHIPDISLLIYFTDLMVHHTNYPEQPEYAVLWARTMNTEPLWGAVVDLFNGK